MKKIEIAVYGVPEEVARCVEAPDVGAPGAGGIVFDILAFPINPADLSFCRGTYRLAPALPATPGGECVGRVTAISSDVSGISPGDLVIQLLAAPVADVTLHAVIGALVTLAAQQLEQRCHCRVVPKESPEIHANRRPPPQRPGGP
jgi:NADPH:quinone reductase-like Zn-dependent oxidoreductase